MLIDFILKNRQKYINFLIIKKHYTSFNIFKLSVTKSTDVGLRLSSAALADLLPFFSKRRTNNRRAGKSRCQRGALSYFARDE